MSGLFSTVEADVVALFNATWTQPASVVPVFWRGNDLEVLPDPSTTRYFLRNEILFGSESVVAFGGGLGRNEKILDGAVAFIAFASRSLVRETQILDYLWEATNAFRSKRVAGTFPGGSDLSFTGNGSHFHVDPEEDGNWFIRGFRMAFEYRFVA